MGYIIGIDGGGTKTRGIVGDLNGNIICDITGDGSNHQHIGPSKCKDAINSLYINLLTKANITENEIDHIYLGLSGADVESDFSLLNEICSSIFTRNNFTVVNDAWIIMRSGLKSSFGAVAICGTGTNSAARNMENKTAILRALAYELGSFGGGMDIAREGLHYAFKANELTGKSTILTDKIPGIFNVNTIEEVIHFFYPEVTADSKTIGQVTRILFECASLGDEVSQDILLNCGEVVGKQTAGVIKQLSMENLEIPVVIGGTVFSGTNPLFMDQFKLTLHRTAPKAYVVIPEYPPVYGAYLSCLDLLNIKQTDVVDSNLKASISK